MPVMMVVMMMVLVLMLCGVGGGRSLPVEMRLFVLVDVRIEDVVEGHPAEKLAKNVHRIFEDEVEVSLMVMVVMPVMMIPVVGAVEGVLEAEKLVRLAAVLLETGVTESVVDPPLIRISEHLCNGTRRQGNGDQRNNLGMK